MSTYILSLEPKCQPMLAFCTWQLHSPLPAQQISLQQLTENGLPFQGELTRISQPCQLLLEHAGQREVLLNLEQVHSDQTYAFNVQIKLQSERFSLLLKSQQNELVLLTGEVQGAFKVLQGKQGWLFLDNDTNKSVEQFTGQIRLDPATCNQWQQYMQQLLQLSARYQNRSCLLLAPAKEEVYPQYYPYPRAEKNALDDLLQLASSNFPLVYPQQSLASSIEPRSFRVTDTHWSPWGAMLATIETAVTLGLQREAVSAVFKNDVYYSKVLCGDLGNKLYPPQQHAESLLRSYNYRKHLVYDNQLPNFGRVMVMSQPKALLPEHCLIFGSSSSYSMLDYLSRIFQTLTMVHTAGNVDQQLLSELKPRFLITQTNARFIVRAPNMDYRLVKSIAEKVQRDTPEQISQQKQALSAMLAAKPHPVAEIVHQYFLAATTPF